MKSDIVIIGAGASGLMAAYSAAGKLRSEGSDASVTLLEKMPRAGRKIMITGKGRCNFTNLKDWNEFSGHIRSNSRFVKSSFQNLPSGKVVSFFEEFGMHTVVERGDRAYPASYRASDVVDTLVSACQSQAVKIEYEAEVSSVAFEAGRFRITMADGGCWICSRLIIATGGLSYPATGSTGDGYRWAETLGHGIVPTFPSLTALVPSGYKSIEGTRALKQENFHIDRSTGLSETGSLLCGIQLKNVAVSLGIAGNEVQNEFGDLDFTDGGIEGPVGFQISRKAVKAMINGAKVTLDLDLKPGVALTELTERVKELWTEIDRDPRSRGVREKEKCRILLGKLMPWDLIPGFTALNPGIMTLERRGRQDTKVWVNLPTIAKSLKKWHFDIIGYVGYERAVVTAGGVDTEGIVSKTMESRIVPGLYFCGEVLDVDCDTGGYNLQSAFSTGALAGINAARSLQSKDL